MESRAKETAKKTAKKGKNGIVKLIFSRIFIFALLIFLQLLVLFYFFWHVNEQFKIFYDSNGLPPIFTDTPCLWIIRPAQIIAPEPSVSCFLSINNHSSSQIFRFSMQKSLDLELLKNEGLQA